MGKNYISYSFSGYRYAPESFQAFKRICGGERSEISLSFDQRSTVGYLYLTQGPKAAAAYVKRVEREREQKRQCNVTYGFLTLEEPNTYIYSPQLFCRTDDPPAVKVVILRTLRHFLQKTGGKLELSARCELDGQYRPTNVVRNCVTADFTRPVSILLKSV